MSTGRNCPLTKSHPNHLSVGRVVAMTELGGTRAKNVLSQLPMMVVEPRVASAYESGTWPPLS